MLHFISSSVVRCSCLPLKTAQRHMRTKIIITLILSALPLVCSAQKWSISTTAKMEAAEAEARNGKRK